MPLECSLCKRNNRNAIDAAIVAGNETLRAMAARFGTSTGTLLRHKLHVQTALATSYPVGEVCRAGTLMGKVLQLEADARRIAAAAEEAGDMRMGLLAIRELTRIVELLGRVSGELAQGTINVQNNVAVQVRQMTDADLVGHLELVAAEGRRQLESKTNG